MLRETPESLAPIMSGIRKLPSTAGIDGIEEEEHHHHAVHREELVVDVRLDTRSPCGRRQLEPDEHGEQRRRRRRRT